MREYFLLRLTPSWEWRRYELWNLFVYRILHALCAAYKNVQDEFGQKKVEKYPNDVCTLSSCQLSQVVLI